MVHVSVTFDCEICHPAEGITINCIVKNVTKAGIRAEVIVNDETPIVVFIARDHNFNNKEFGDVKESDVIVVKIVGKRYELEDTFISVIGELVKRSDQKQRISILDEDLQ